MWICGRSASGSYGRPWRALGNGESQTAGAAAVCMSPMLEVKWRLQTASQPNTATPLCMQGQVHFYQMLDELKLLFSLNYKGRD